MSIESHALLKRNKLPRLFLAGSTVRAVLHYWLMFC